MKYNFNIKSTFDNCKVVYRSNQRGIKPLDSWDAAYSAGIQKMQELKYDNDALYEVEPVPVAETTTEEDYLEEIFNPGRNLWD